mmetsp:Transcript_47198/g.135240  ORF Transcript_47198/g.135240 Transcript_47198/m.135240 type:complete len:251 (-) Transcript_47198:252-1004(-)
MAVGASPRTAPGALWLGQGPFTSRVRALHRRGLQKAGRPRPREERRRRPNAVAPTVGRRGEGQNDEGAAAAGCRLVGRQGQHRGPPEAVPRRLFWHGRRSGGGAARAAACVAGDGAGEGADSGAHSGSAGQTARRHCGGRGRGRRPGGGAPRALPRLLRPGPGGGRRRRREAGRGGLCPCSGAREVRSGGGPDRPGGRPELARRRCPGHCCGAHGRPPVCRGEGCSEGGAPTGGQGPGRTVRRGVRAACA